jgi:signal transduction histidine kinase
VTELALALGAISLVGIGAVYWHLRFRMLLPLEARLKRERVDWGERAAFAQELLESHPLPENPEGFHEAIQFGVDRFLARFGNVDAFVWIRRAPVGAFAGTDGDLVVRTGALESLESSDLKIEEELWEKAFSDPRGVAFFEAIPGDAGRLLSSRGLRALRLLPWGTRDRLWGLIGAVASEGRGGPTERHAESLGTLAAYFSSMAERASHFWELDRAREQLQGGLDVTMRRLDETNLQLIQRAKEMKTLQEVTDIISEHPDQPDVLSAIVAIVAKSLDADICALLTLDEETGELVTLPGAHGITEGDQLYRIPLTNEQSSSVRVFRSGKPFLTSDAQNDPNVIARYAKLWNCRSLMVVPLRVESQRIGVMRVGSFKKDLFSKDHIGFVQVIAEEAAVLIESAVLARKLQETNLELQRMHSMKDEFVSTVSHEFKTPLTSIQGFLSVLLDGDTGELTDEQTRFLKIVKSAADRLHLLVTDLLDLSKLEGGIEIELEAVDLFEAARKAVEGQRIAAEGKRVLLSLRDGQELPKVHGNSQWLGQVFDNLISNAIKFSPAGGRIEIGLENKGEGVLVYVSDEGIGIPSGEQDRVFEKFFRASNRDEEPAPGTGLGLAICRQIIDRHGGRIWFESESGKGTRFYFVVPTERSAAPVGAEES